MRAAVPPGCGAHSRRRIPPADPGANRIDISVKVLMPGKGSEVQPYYSLK